MKKEITEDGLTDQGVSSIWVRMAKTLNIRVIKTSYLKSTIYFIIAIGIFLLFYLFSSRFSGVIQ